MSETSRREILSRIEECDYDAAARAYAQLAPLPVPSPVGSGLDRFAARVREYGAAVEILEAAGIAGWIAGYLRQRGLDRLLVGPSSSWAEEAWAVPDVGLPNAVLDTIGAALVEAVAGLADTGTVVIDGRRDRARRALSLIPDTLICLVRGSTVRESLEEWWEPSAPDRPITLISGPSATSDIELERVVGVHGPRRLQVVVLRDV